MRARFPSTGAGRRTSAAALLLALALACPADAADTMADEAAALTAPCLPPGVATAEVAGVVDGATLLLADGTELRLAGIAAPLPPLGRTEADWPLAASAKDALARLAVGRSIRIDLTNAAPDRYGRRIGFASADGVPLQQAVLAEGLARVVPGGEPASCLVPLLAAEAEGREKRLGLWADPYYAIRAARDRTLAERGDAYDVVEGRVLHVGLRGPIAYLDFGRDWRTDFTAVVTGAAGLALASLGRGPQSLEGRRVRLRGWIEQRDGPSLRIAHPAQLELLDDGD